MEEAEEEEESGTERSIRLRATKSSNSLRNTKRKHKEWQAKQKRSPFDFVASPRVRWPCLANALVRFPPQTLPPGRPGPARIHFDAMVEVSIVLVGEIIELEGRPTTLNLIENREKKRK